MMKRWIIWSRCFITIKKRPLSGSEAVFPLRLPIKLFILNPTMISKVPVIKSMRHKKKWGIHAMIPSEMNLGFKRSFAH